MRQAPDVPVDMNAAIQGEPELALADLHLTGKLLHVGHHGNYSEISQLQTAQS